MLVHPSVQFQCLNNVIAYIIFTQYQLKNPVIFPSYIAIYRLPCDRRLGQHKTFILTTSVEQVEQKAAKTGILCTCLLQHDTSDFHRLKTIVP